MSSITPSSQSKPHALIPPWLKGKWGFLGIIFIVYILLDLAWTYFHWGGAERVTLISDLFSMPPGLLAASMAWYVATRPTFTARLRRAWFLLGLGVLMFLIGNIIWFYLEVFLSVEPFPSIADIFYLAFYPFVLLGILTLPDISLSRRDYLTLTLDLLSVMIAATMLVGYFIIIPTVIANNSDTLTEILSCAYPISSLILLGGILATLYRRPSANAQRLLFFLLTGMIVFVASDFTFGYISVAGTYTVGGWPEAGWNVAQLFFGLAALYEIYHSTTSAPTKGSSTLRSKFTAWLPLAAVMLAYGLVFYVVIVNNTQAAVWLIDGALLLTLLVVARQIISPAFADMPVRVKMILTFIFVSVISVILVFVMAFLTLRSNLETVVGDKLKADVEFRAQTLGNEVSKQIDLLEGLVLGETIEYGVAEGNAHYTEPQTAMEIQLQERGVLTNPMARELDDFRFSYPNHNDLLLTDQHGRTIAATTRPDHYSQVSEEWWQSAYNQGRGAIYIGQPTLDNATQDLQVIVAVPVHADHTKDVIGVLRTTFRLQSILEMLTPPDLETLVGFNLLVPGGQLVHPQGITEDLEPDVIAHLQSSQKADYASMSFEGKLQLISQAPMVSPDAEETDAFKALNWRVIAHEESAAAFAPLFAASQTTLLTLLFVLFLTSGVAAILSQVLIAPISRLTAVARQITAGDLTAKAQIESHDEIGTLAATFNSMLNAVSLAQRELQESEALYRSLVEYSPDMIAVHSNGKYIFVNPAGVELLGAKSADTIIGRPLMDVILSEDKELVQQGIEFTQGTGEPTPLLEQKIRRLDGTVIQVELKAIPILYEGRPAIQTVMRDITERKNAQEKIHQLLAQVAHQRGELEIRVAERTEELNSLNQQLQNELVERQHLMVSLRDSEERFRLLFEASPDAILLLDPNDPNNSWPIVDCNEVACIMNGYIRGELIGQSIDLLNASPGDAAERAEYLGFLRHQGVLHRDGFHRHKDGHVFPIEVSSSLINFADRELVLGIDRDITERKQTELALQQAKDAAETSQHAAEEASRAKSEFLSRMSHELRTPMNAILGFAQLLEMSQKEPLSSSQKERVKQIVKGGQHLLDLINEILDISRIEASRLQVSPEPVSIREGVQEVLDLSVPLAVKRHIQIVTRLGGMDANPFVLADRQRLKQVLLNLVGNAVKYNYDGGSVIISCQQASANKWRISVADSGPGISQENLARLFIPFERLNADQPNVEGTGLGLVLAKRLVELMHGQMGVDSTFGRGSTFWIELPSTKSPLERANLTSGTGRLSMMSATARKILYVEDNVANFDLIKEVLADYSQIEMLWATDAKSGIELAQKHHPNLILLDLHLGGSDGADLLEQLKQDKGTAEIPVVVVSADATSGQAHRLTSLGAHTYLTKPLDVKQFVRLMEELLSEKEIEYGR